MKVNKYFSDKSNTLLPNNISSDVLLTDDSKLLRAHDLKRAVILGSTYNLESGLEYVDNSGRNRVVISKVIGLSSENALLQNDRLIPIRSICRVMV